MTLAGGYKPRPPGRARPRGRFKPTVPARALPAPQAPVLLLLQHRDARNDQVLTTAQPSLSLHPGSFCWEQTCLGHLGHLWPGGHGAWAWGSAEGRAGSSHQSCRMVSPGEHFPL